MKLAIQEILRYVLEHQELSTRSAVDSYFDQFLFSLEKQEWEGLSDQEKQRFADQLDLQIERPLEVPGLGDKMPSK